MKSGDFSISRDDDYYRNEFTEIVDREFVQRTFASTPALVANDGHIWREILASRLKPRSFTWSTACGITSTVPCAFSPSRTATRIGRIGTGSNSCATHAMKQCSGPNQSLEPTAGRFVESPRFYERVSGVSHPRPRQRWLSSFSLIWLCSCQRAKWSRGEYLHRIHISRKRV